MTNFGLVLVVEIEAPTSDSPFAGFTAYEYITRPDMLKFFEETAEFDYGRCAEVSKIYLEPKPLPEHRTVIDYARYSKNIWGRDIISIRIPVPNLLKVAEEITIRNAETTSRLEELKQRYDKLVESEKKERSAKEKREAESRSAISNLREQIHLSKADHQSEISNLTQQINLSKADHQSKISNLTQQIHLSKADHQSEISNLTQQMTLSKADHQSEISKLREEMKIMEVRLEDKYKEENQSAVIDAVFTTFAEATKRFNASLRENQPFTETPIARDDELFTMCKGNLLMDLIKKLLPEEARKATPMPERTKWMQIAENYAEEDFKAATKGFGVSEESAEVMEIFQDFGKYVNERNKLAHVTHGKMASLLISSTYRKDPDNQVWRDLFEYVYREKVERVAGRELWSQFHKPGRP